MAQTSVVPSANMKVGYLNPTVYQPIQVATVQKVPNMTGVSFHLLSSSDKPAHDLAIQSETYLSNGSATFTGTWKSDGNANSVPKSITGTLKFDANGNVQISFSWTNGSGGQNNFLGTIRKVYNPGPCSYDYINGYHYHLEGDVTTPTPGDGPGHVSGDGALPPLLFKASF